MTTEEPFTILALLSNEEKKQLPTELGKKLQDLWDTKLKEFTNLKVELEKQKINADQDKFQLERQLVGIRSQCEEESRQKSASNKQKETLTKKVSKLEDELQQAKAKISSLSKEIESSQHEQENASSQSAAMAGSLESRTRHVQDLQDQVNNLTEQLNHATKAKCDAIIQVEEAKSRELQLQYKEKRLEKEHSLMSHQVELLQYQIKQRVEESITQHQEQSTTILGLQTDLVRKLEELRIEKLSNEQLQKQIEEKSHRIEELLATLNTSRESEAKLDETYRQELIAQKKLADIYQGAADNEKERSGELEKGVDELRRLLQEASEQYGALERAKKRSEEEAAENLQQSKLLINELKEELDKVNLVLQASSKKDEMGLEDISPAASAASQLVSRGLSLSQLYSEYMSVSEKLLTTEEENKRLKRYVDQILQEIEDRVPVFKKQREDHQRSLETITSLHAQMEDTLAEMEKQRSEADEARRRTKYLERENERYETQVKDLSKQVTVLVMQVEAARSGLPMPEVPKERFEKQIFAGDVISQRLVAFRNMAELQSQNNMLRTSLRELSEKMEATENDAVKNRTSELQEELKKAQTQLAELQASRERQELSMENIVRQRDMYRSLLSQQSPKVGSKPTPASQEEQEPIMVPKEEFDRVRDELEASKKEIEIIKKEQEDYRTEKGKNDKMLQEEYDNLRATMEKTRDSNIKLLSQAEYNEERLKNMQTNTEVLQRQIMGLEKNNSTLQGIIGRHEGTIESLRTECMALQKKLSHAEVTVINLREERTLLKECEARLLAERESGHREHAAQSILLANLESIKNNLERSDSDAKMRYENRITDLTEQCSRLKAKLESNSDLKEARSKLAEAELRIKEVHLEHANTTKELLDVKNELVTTKTKLQEAQEKARVAVSPSMRGGRGGSPLMSSPPQRMQGPPGMVRDLQVQLTEEKAKSNTLQQGIEQARRNLNELTQVTKRQEKQIAESNETCKTIQEQLEKLKKEKGDVERKVKKLEDDLKDAADNTDNVKKLMEAKVAKMRDELQAAQKQLSDAKSTLKEAKEEEENARREAQHQARLAGEVQDKYEREVMLHGTDLKALATLKEKQAEFSEELQKANSARLKAEEAVRDTRLGFEERENVLRRENKELLVRSHELDEQNKSLLDQFTQLSDKMAAVQTKMTSSGDSANVSFSEDEARTSDQLREVIKYLRRERDVSAGKCEVLQAESQRLGAQKKILEAQVEQITKSLTEEREKSQVSLDSAGRYGELMRKVHTVDALADSNRLLREEKDDLLTKSTELKARYDALEKKFEPLQEKQRINVTKIESLMVEKKTLENEKELYKKRTQELVEKLNRAKPEDFVKLQQDAIEHQKAIQNKDLEISRLKNQVSQIIKNQQAIVTQKNQMQQQLHGVREDLRKATEEARKNLLEKNRLQQQYGEENKKLSLEKSRLMQQMNQCQERIRGMEQTQAAHQQEMGKAQEQRNQEKQQDKQQLQDSKIREDNLKNQLETSKKELQSVTEKLNEAENKLDVTTKKLENSEKQALQLRKIATKYKKAVEGAAPTAAVCERRNLKGNAGKSKGADGSDGEAAGGAATSAGMEKVKELEETIANFRQKQLKAQYECTNLQQEVTTLKQTLETKENENAQYKTQGQQKDTDLSKLRTELENKTRELQVAQNMATQLKQTVSKQIADITKKLEESQEKKAMYEAKIAQLEKERDQYAREVEMLNKKLQMQQRQLENLQKQAAGTSKPSTSGVSSEKSGFEPPPTANIKPMSAPGAASASPRSQTTTQVVPHPRPIPTASIRPMAPPSGGSAPPQGSSVMVVSPLETHSDGMVSSTVTLPQATVTPTPAISAPTLPTTATATSTATTMTTTLTATVSPTPASASLTTPVAPALAMPSVASSQPSSHSSSATQSSSASQSTAAIVESTPATQSASAGQSSPSSKTLQTAPAASSTVAQSAVANQSTSSTQQSGTASTSIVAPVVSATAVSATPGASTPGTTTAAATLTSSKGPGTASHRQESQEVSADALVSQAIALVTPLSSKEVAKASGSGVQKRKVLDSSEASPMKRSRNEEEAGPSSSHAGQDNEDPNDAADNDVVLLDSDEDEEPGDEYGDQGEEDDDDDEDEDDQMDDEDQEQDIQVIDSDDDDDEMDHEDTSQECSQGFEAERDGREAEDMGNAEAEAEPASEASTEVESGRDDAQEAPSESQRPQPSAGPSQPSSSSRASDTPSQTPRTPLALARAVGRQERLGSVGRQNLTPFSQLPQYEESGDDSIVPSTPTLFAPRRGDGFSEAVSSPQVPSGGFVFGSNPELANPPQTSGLAQMAEGGLIDDTRMDLAQLDEGNRSQPSTPVRRSPTEGGVSTSEGESGQREPPTILVTGAEQSNDENTQGSEGNFTEADSVAAEVGDGAEEGEDEETEEEVGAEADDAAGEGDDEDGTESEERQSGEAGEAEERVVSDDNSQPAQDVSSVPSSTPSLAPTSSQQRRITPITWDDSPQRARPDRGRGFMLGHGGRGLMRGTPPLARGGFPSVNFPSVAPRGVNFRGTQRARRSRPGSFSRGGPM